MQPSDTEPPGTLVSFDAWLRSLGKTRYTGHRWRKQYPWIDAGVVKVFGKLYIRRSTIAEFERRAYAGELSRAIKPDPTSRQQKHLRR